MFKKYVSLMLAILVINLACGVTVFASNLNDEKEAEIAQKAKTEINKIGTGKNAQVKVKLKDGTKIRGYVSEITNDGFTIMNEKTNVPAKILYSQATQTKSKNSKKRLAIAGIVIGIVAVVIIVVAGRKG